MFVIRNDWEIKMKREMDVDTRLEKLLKEMGIIEEGNIVTDDDYEECFEVSELALDDEEEE